MSAETADVELKNQAAEEQVVKPVKAEDSDDDDSDEEEERVKTKGGCCCCAEDKFDKGVPDCKFVEYEDRGCADIQWLLAFIGGCVLFVSIYLGLEDPSPTRVLSGNDWAGNVCGSTPGYEDLGVAIWPSLVPGPDNYLVKFCAASCDEAMTHEMMITPYEATNYLGYCLPANLEDLTAVIAGGGGNSTYESLAFDFSTGITDAVSDVWTAQFLIYGAMVFAVIVSFFYDKVIGTVGACIVWFLSFSFLAMGLASGYFLYDYAESAEEIGDEDAEYYLYGAYVAWGLTFLLLCFLCAIRKKIQMALAIMKSAGDSAAAMPLLFLVPFIPFVAIIIYFAIWCWFAVSIVSISNPETMVLPAEFAYFSAWDVADGQFVDLVYDTNQNANFGYVFFHMLWTTQFLIYLNYLIVAGAIAKWYFLPIDEATKEKVVPSGYVCSSVKRTCRYNLGSVAFGSFVLAVVKFIHACFLYLMAQREKMLGEPNAAEKVFICVVECCLRCIECCIDKLSKNAYCYIGAWGGSFLTGTCKTVELFCKTENMIRAAAMSYTSQILLFVGKVFVALSTTAVAAVVLTYAYGDQLSSILLPMVIVFMLSMFIGEIFMLELEVAVDVIFLCFCVDLETHNGTIKYGTNEIRHMFDAHVEEHENQHMSAKDLKKKKKKQAKKAKKAAEAQKEQ